MRKAINPSHFDDQARYPTQARFEACLKNGFDHFHDV
jgi:hypothetical protein